MARIRTFAAAAGIALASVAPGLAQDANDLFAVAESNDQFSTLVEALRASDAGWFLEEDMQYTLFAPTDEAFNKLPDGVLDALLQPDNRPKLNAILERHVVPDQQVASGDLSDGQAIDPATGEPLEVSMSGDTVMIADANVVQADIQTENGVVHAIDTVLVPDLVIEAMKYRGEWPEEG